MTSDVTLAPYVRRAGGNASIWYVGHLFTFLAESQDTNGQFSLIEMVIRQGFEPPPHIHHREDECYYILDGTLTFVIDGATIDAQAGDVVFLPRGVQHGFRLTTPQVRAVVLLSPAGLEEAFRELGEPAEELALPPIPAGPPNLPRMLAVYDRYGIEFSRPRNA
jgi:quercetin dioxygenase-like cupin family protein